MRDPDGIVCSNEQKQKGGGGKTEALMTEINDFSCLGISETGDQRSFLQRLEKNGKEKKVPEKVDLKGGEDGRFVRILLESQASNPMQY